MRPAGYAVNAVILAFIAVVLFVVFAFVVTTPQHTIALVTTEVNDDVPDPPRWRTVGVDRQSQHLFVYTIVNRYSGECLIIAQTGDYSQTTRVAEEACKE